MEEKLLLQANEILLRSKGFLLFTVNQYGMLQTAFDTQDLSPEERRQLEDFRKADMDDLQSKAVMF